MILMNDGVMVTMYQMCVILVVSWKLRIVTNASGVKKLLGRVGLVNLMGFISYFFTSQVDINENVLDVTSLVTIAAVQCNCFIITTIIPLWKSYHQSKGIIQSETSADLLEEFLLSTPERFSAFKYVLYLWSYGSRFCEVDMIGDGGSKGRGGEGGEGGGGCDNGGGNIHQSFCISISGTISYPSILSKTYYFGMMSLYSEISLPNDVAKIVMN